MSEPSIPSTPEAQVSPAPDFPAQVVSAPEVVAAVAPAPSIEAPSAPEAPRAEAGAGSPLSNEAQPELATARIRGRRPLPASPLERAQLESQGLIPSQTAEEDRSTMVAFGLLFVVPILIILLSLLLLFPFINAQVNQEPDPGGAATQSISKGETPAR